MGGGTDFFVFLDLVAIPSQANYTVPLSFYSPDVYWVCRSEIFSDEAFMNCIKVQSLKTQG